MGKWHSTHTHTDTDMPIMLMVEKSCSVKFVIILGHNVTFQPRERKDTG